MKIEQSEIDTPPAETSPGLFGDAPAAMTAVVAAPDSVSIDDVNETRDEAGDEPEAFQELSAVGKSAMHTALLIARKRDSDTGPGKSLVYNALDTFSAFTSVVLGASNEFFQSREDAVTTEEYQKLCSALELMIEVQSGIEEREKIAEAKRTAAAAKSTLFEAARIWDSTPGDYKADAKS